MRSISPNSRSPSVGLIRAPFDLVPFVGQYFGEAMNTTFGSHACTGTGSGMPQGYNPGSVTVQAAGTLFA